MSDPDPAATPDDQTRPEPSGDGQRKQRPAWVVARKRRQKADKRRRLVRIGAGLAIVAVLVLAHRTWRSATDDGELSGDEFGDRCADQVDGNADRPPLIVDEVEVSRDLSGDSPSDGAERRIARVRLHRLGDVQIEARQDRVELVREGLTWKVVGIPDILAVTPDQLNEANENDNEDDSTPASGGQAVGTPGSDEADASGRVVPTFERVELQDRLVDVVDRSGRTCWRYEDRGATYPGNVPPMIGIVRAFGDRAGEVEVAVRACPDDAAAQDAAEHLVNQAVIDDDAARTQVPGLDGAVGVTLACPAPALTCDSQATAYVVRDQRLVSVDVDSADIATAATVLRSQLDQL